MQLTIREAASYFGVNEQTFRRWISQRGLPVHEVYERIYLNPLELWEWAVEQGIPVSRGLLERARRSPEEAPRLADLLRAGARGVRADLSQSARAVGMGGRAGDSG